MNSQAVEAPEKGNQDEHGTDHGTVSITIDTKPLRTRRGMHDVSELKTLGGVPQEYALDQVVSGEIKPLADDGKVHIRGDEVFISHPKDSSSS